MLIMDGFGLAPADAGNAIAAARTPELDALFASCPHTRLDASGEAVGLPAAFDHAGRQMPIQMRENVLPLCLAKNLHGPAAPGCSRVPRFLPAQLAGEIWEFPQTGQKAGLRAFCKRPGAFAGEKQHGVGFFLPGLLG